MVYLLDAFQMKQVMAHLMIDLDIKHRIDMKNCVDESIGFT